MKSIRPVIGGTLLLVFLAAGTSLFAQETLEDVDCSQVTDPKKHGRSGKSYWAVATKKEPFDLEVLKKAEIQFALALCEGTGIPDHWEWNMFMGMVKCEFEEYDQAAPYFERALASTDDEDDKEKIEDNRKHYWVKLYNDGFNFFNEEAYALAAEAAEKAVALDPTDCRAYGLLGPAFVNTQKYQEAVRVLEKGFEMCPNDENLAENLFAAYHNRGNALYNEAPEGESDEAKSETYHEAIENYRKADEVDPEHLGNLYQLGVASLQAVQLGDSTLVDVCRDAFTRFIDLSETVEDKKVALYNLTLLLMESEAWKGAEEAATQYTQLAPFDADGYALMARVLMNTDREEEVEPYIIFSNSLREDKVEDPGTWCEEAKGRYGASSDFTKMINETGVPNDVWVHADSQGNDMLAIYYDGQAKLVAFYAGGKRGETTVSREG